MNQNLKVTTSTNISTINAKWQTSQSSNVTKNIPNGWVIMMLDFAENFVCTYQDEIQSAQWYHTLWFNTLHPIVLLQNVLYVMSLCMEVLYYITRFSIHCMDFNVCRQSIGSACLGKKYDVDMLLYYTGFRVYLTYSWGLSVQIQSLLWIRSVE